MSENVFLRVKCEGLNDGIIFPMSTILSLAGLNGKATDAELIVKSDDGDLSASVDLLNVGEYPGINIDGHDKNDRVLWLANVELPNETAPTEIRARLYAGYAAQEADGPIAMAKHGIDKGPAYQGKPAPTKVVYVDTDIAQYRPWREDREMPEHVEDE